MATITRANQEWATRPADRRFTSLTDLHRFTSSIRSRSASKVVSSRALTVEPTSNTHDAGLAIIGQNGHPADFTHWSFGQLANLSGAPAGYLRKLPAPIAADCLNYGLKHARDVEDVGVLLTRETMPDVTANPGAVQLRAATGPNYGRIWNSDLTGGLVKRFGDGLTGDFRIPGEFGQRVEVTKANTTLYASDRDLFVFLADEEHRIELPNRRDGATGSLARGFYVWNSEVGAGTLGAAFFLFDYVCKNRIIWGARQFTEVRIRHTAGAPDRWLAEIQPVLEDYATSAAKPVVEAIEAARAKRIDDLDAFLGQRFGRNLVSAIKDTHETEELRPIANLWDAATAVTAYARSVPYQDQRVNLEREAGKLLKLAA